MHIFNSARLFCLHDAYKKPQNGFFICVFVWLWTKWGLGMAFESCLLHIKLKKINFYMRCHVLES